MSTVEPIAPPLEANDLERARVLKAKIRDRVSDVRRHLLALRAAPTLTAEMVRETLEQVRR